MIRTEQIARLLHPDRWLRHDAGASGHAHDCEIADSLALARRVLPLFEATPEMLRAGGAVEIRATCGECPSHHYDLGDDQALAVWAAMVGAR